jgi:hypothetical protein
MVTSGPSAFAVASTLARTSAGVPRKRTTSMITQG